MPVRAGIMQTLVPGLNGPDGGAWQILIKDTDNGIQIKAIQDKRGGYRFMEEMNTKAMYKLSYR